MNKPTKYRWIRLMLERKLRFGNYLYSQDYKLGNGQGVVCANFVDAFLDGKPSHITFTLSITPLRGGRSSKIKRYCDDYITVPDNKHSHLFNELRKNLEDLDIPNSGRFYYRFDKLSAKDYAAAE